jgi:hypothetical protein
MSDRKKEIAICYLLFAICYNWSRRVQLVIVTFGQLCLILWIAKIGEENYIRIGAKA